MNISIGNLCACLGPQGTDEYCPCRMRALGLESSVKPLTEDEKEAQRKRLEAALRKMFPIPQEDTPDAAR